MFELHIFTTYIVYDICSFYLFAIQPIDKMKNVEKVVEKIKVDLKIFDTTPYHANLYGFKSHNPLFVQITFDNQNEEGVVLSNDFLKGIDEFAKKNKHDLVFGNISQKLKPCVDEVKKILANHGYSTIEGNDDFYKYVTLFDNSEK
jgi:hypothetical protein